MIVNIKAAISMTTGTVTTASYQVKTQALIKLIHPL
jgi:hypothetical protein